LVLAKLCQVSLYRRLRVSMPRKCKHLASSLLGPRCMGSDWDISVPLLRRARSLL
jgi:hypothetical protein